MLLLLLVFSHNFKKWIKNNCSKYLLGRGTPPFFNWSSQIGIKGREDSHIQMVINWGYTGVCLFLWGGREGSVGTAGQPGKRSRALFMSVIPGPHTTKATRISRLASLPPTCCTGTICYCARACRHWEASLHTHSEGISLQVESRHPRADSFSKNSLLWVWRLESRVPQNVWERGFLCALVCGQSLL